jgi:hypothetical protein
MCLGRVSKKWALAAQHYDVTQYRDGGLYWTSLLTTALWRYSKILWRFHNEVVHGSAIEEQTTLQLRALRDKIVSYYHDYSENPQYDIGLSSVSFYLEANRGQNQWLLRYHGSMGALGGRGNHGPTTSRGGSQGSLSRVLPFPCRGS